VIEHSIETSLHLMQVRVTESVSLLDLVNFLTTVQKDPQYGPALNTMFIVDTDARFVQLVPGALNTFFRRVEGSGGSAAWAIVVFNETHHSMFSRLAQNFVSKRMKIRVFRDELAALQWLKSS
jgi:hypothetical protein